MALSIRTTTQLRVKWSDSYIRVTDYYIIFVFQVTCLLNLKIVYDLPNIRVAAELNLKLKFFCFKKNIELQNNLIITKVLTDVLYK